MATTTSMLIRYGHTNDRVFFHQIVLCFGNINQSIGAWVKCSNVNTVGGWSTVRMLLLLLIAFL